MIEVEVDQARITALSRLLRAEANSAVLRKELITNIRAAVSPGIDAVKGKLQAVPSTGPEHSPSLSSYLAARVKSQVRLTGLSAGVRVRIAQTPSLRGFKLAAKRLNQKKWRHRVYGRDRWVEQESPIPGYFDDTLYARKAEYYAAVVAACHSLARRLGRRF